MTKYLIQRVLRGVVSVIIVVAIVMLLVYTLIDREQVFKMDGLFTKKQSNDRIEYKYQQWESYGYVDYVTYSEYLGALLADGEISREVYDQAVLFGYSAEKDNPIAKEYIGKFTATYESRGYKIVRLDADFANASIEKLKNGGVQKLFATKDTPVFLRMLHFFTGIVEIDSVHYSERNTDDPVENPGISFTLFDPVYNTDSEGNLTHDHFSPAIIGNGTRYKYLLYFDSSFPFIHQNLIHIKLGTSYSIRHGVDVWDTMTQPQGSNIKSTTTYPSGYTTETSVNFHSATYAAHSLENPFNQARFVDNYTSTDTVKGGFSKMSYSFIIGVIASILAYLIGIPVGILMARRKDKLADKIGSFYIIFIIAVPSLAYIFMFRAIGMAMGLPITFDIDAQGVLIYILPIVSLALPSIGALMKWIRRYTIDQSNSDYVRFARAGGLSESEIFRNHILKNAAIPIVHGIPGSILGALVGAIITERVYTVPGTGGMLTNAITYYDNAAIIGLTLFYASLSIISLILGDILMAMMDPRISFSEKGR